MENELDRFDAVSEVKTDKGEKPSLLEERMYQRLLRHL